MHFLNLARLCKFWTNIASKANDLYAFHRQTAEEDIIISDINMIMKTQLQSC